MESNDEVYKLLYQGKTEKRFKMILHAKQGCLKRTGDYNYNSL